MSEKSKKKQPLPLWRKCAFLAVVLILVGRTLWLIPRTNWSITGEQTTGLILKTASTQQNIRNIVLISIDTCRADHLSCYGYSRNTSPNIDAVAAEGILFNHAVSNVPLTLPSHSSMLTGTIPPYHKVRDNNNYRLNGSNLTLAEILRDSGFATAAVIGSFILDSQFGLDQGFDYYDDNLARENKVLLELNERGAQEVTYSANTWLENHRYDRFFLFIHYYDPHRPYESHKRFPFTFLPFLSNSKDRYDSEIAYTDHFIGKVIKKLKDLNLYDSTLLIITADHGESLGQHDERTHGFFIYHSTLHVPLVIKLPGGPAGRKINDTVGLIDIVPTVCALLDIPVPTNVQGRDLNAVFSRRTASVKQRFIYCESLVPTKFGLGPLVGLVSDRWKYIHTSKPELFDLGDTPLETSNLIHQQTQKTRIMQEQLKSILQSDTLAKTADSKVAMDEETRKRLESLGYIAGRTVDENIRLDQTGADLKQFIEVYNSIDTFFALVAAKKYDKANKLCHKMLAKWPDMEQIHFFLGFLAVYQEDMPAIINHFSRFLTQAEPDPNDSNFRLQSGYEYATAHNNMGVAFISQGKIEQAIKHYQKALSYDPYSTQANYNLANAYQMQGSTINAISYYNTALELNPDFPEAHFMLANALLAQAKLEEAIMHYNKALTLRPDWQEARHNLEVAQNLKKQNEKK